MLSAARLPMAERCQFELPTGTLRVTVDRADWPLDDLCAFASRNNPRRGFLVVSRVLGRHIPTAPSVMRASARDLAGLISGDLPGPVLVLGLAETAICLGQTVHQELRTRTGRDDIFFIHSTRQRIDEPLLCRFEEPHSHASAHLIYAPQIAGFQPPGSLVIVDDEISTGTTLSNLAAALIACWPEIETVTAACLTDWSDGVWLAALPRPAAAVSLLQGRLDWTPRDYVVPTDALTGSLGTMVSHRNFGRLGLRQPIGDLPQPLPEAGPRMRVLGTGEFTYPPFQLAETLEAAGAEVVVQATSRSPAPVGGAIATALTFRDNYATGVPNYLYNADPTDGRDTLICSETAAGSIDPALIGALGASLVQWPA